MSSTEGLCGNGVYNKNNNYKKYNTEAHYITLQNIYKKNGSKLLENGLPEIWNLNFMKIHNCMIASSVIIHKSIIEKIGNMSYKKIGEDYDYWLKALKYTNSAYLSDICFYYDNNHGYGQIN